MSRDNSIFFRDEAFPHDRWDELLSLYDASERPTNELDHKHSITHKWTIPTKDDRSVWIDVMRLDASRHLFPEGYRWRVGIHCNSGIPNWFLYAIPMLATVRFSDTIFWDPHPPNGFVTCDLDGILQRADEVVPTRCKTKELVRHGYTTQGSMWPVAANRQSPRLVSDAAYDAALRFCREMKADFYPDPEETTYQPVNHEPREF